ncbi:MAG: molybdopterin molybdotransferase MoeA [Proteobacteria bacterium]|nr:molybdopterin molybdotransferase MoeA [Pseudomonadota bacterium]
MKSFDDAVALACELASPLGSESVALHEAPGRVLAMPVLASRDAPTAPVSTMDGYALREAELSANARLRVVGESFPGRGFDGPVGSGECVRIFTGGPVPGGLDRVVMQEVVRRDGDIAAFEQPLGPERYVRAAGSDFRAGEALLAPGQRLTPAALVAAAAADLGRVEVYRCPRVSILATGDELAAPGEASARPGAIPDSASFGVAALAEAWGARVTARHRLIDDRAILEEAAATALRDSDLVVVIGGASVGEKDFAKAMFEPSGLELVFSKVAIKPGKPVWLGRAQGRLVLGLPGNPGSALVTARLFLAPLLAGLGGRDPHEALAWSPMPMAEALAATGDRETFHRARVTPGGARPVENQDSGAQKALATTDLLVRRLPGAPALAPGEAASVLAL